MQLSIKLNLFQLKENKKLQREVRGAPFQLHQLRLVAQRQLRVAVGVGGVEADAHAGETRAGFDPARVGLAVGSLTAHLRVDALLVV